jgi:hypothetical protein
VHGQKNIKELSESVITVKWNMVDTSTLMMGVRPSGTVFCPPVTIQSVKAQKVNIYRVRHKSLTPE